MNETKPIPELEVSDEYKARRQKDGMWDAMQGTPPQDTLCPYYMGGYSSVNPAYHV